jgi:diaminohydroxyphosphoribosylaminopyrimidine deaminase/5-amino-6-(5-phosphoribosylamino)uracil reductase
MEHESYMRRCFDLARLGARYAKPNPVVGALIVHEGRILGEGFHEQFGLAHAEVNAIKNVPEDEKHLLSESHMYISLEPCCFHGKTPPCTELILRYEIPVIYISTEDPNPNVSGKGISRLRESGIEVHTGILEARGKHLIRPFERFIKTKRPYVILKFAQSKDGYIGCKEEQVILSNPYSKIISHKLRSESDAIMIGTDTAVIDDPSLTNRDYFGASPLRIVFDRTGRIPSSSKLFTEDQPTIVFTEQERVLGQNGHVEQMVVDFKNPHVLHIVLRILHRRNIQRVIIEGGALLLQSFIEAGLWDEAWVFKTQGNLNKGVRAPNITGHLSTKYMIDSNTLLVIDNSRSPYSDLGIDVQVL